MGNFLSEQFKIGKNDLVGRKEIGEVWFPLNNDLKYIYVAYVC